MKDIDYNVVELDLESCINLEGGNPFMGPIYVIGGFVALYEFGYQYAKRHLENAK